MILTIVRTQGPDYTEGTLSVDGAFYCFSLELPWKDNAPQISCIPPGTYPVAVAESPHFTEKFGQPIYLASVLNVPGRSGVEIHGGNTPSDSLGCILCGFTRPGPGLLANSASQKLRAMLQLNKGPHTLVIA